MIRRQREAVAAVAAMLVASLGVAAPAAGQTASDDGVWTALSLRGQVSAESAWRWSADTLVRSRDGVRTLDLALGHVMVMREVGWRIGAGLGYGLVAGFRNDDVLLEHRLTQLVTWTRGGRTRVSLRWLLEERFINGRAAMLRARPQVRLVWPVAAQRRLRGVVSTELLVQADVRSLTSPRLDGTRLFAGVAWMMTPDSAVEIGYMNASTFAGSNRRQISHVLSASLAMTIGR